MKKKKLMLFFTFFSLLFANGIKSNNSSFNVAKAETTDKNVYELVTTDLNAGSSGYDTFKDVTANGVEWKVQANISVRPWKIGGKNVSNTDRRIYTIDPIEAKISKIEFTFKTFSNIKLNTLVVSLFDSKEDVEAKANSIAAISSSNIAANSTVSVEMPENVDCSNKYVDFTFNVTTTTTNKTSTLQFASALFYGEKVLNPSIAITNAPTANLKIGDKGSLTTKVANATNPVISFSSSDETIVSIDSTTGAYEALKAGKVTLTASLTCTESSQPLVTSVECVVDHPLSTVKEALEIASKLNDNELDVSLISIAGYVINLDPSGSQDCVTISDEKKGVANANSLIIHEIYLQSTFRRYAILNSKITVNGYLGKAESGELGLQFVDLLSYEDEAINYAKSANEKLEVECKILNVTSTTWDELKASFANLDEYAQAKLKKANMTTYDYTEDIKNFISRYDYIANKYGYENFINRVNASRKANAISNNNNIYLLSAVGISLISTITFLYYKKQKKSKQN